MKKEAHRTRSMFATSPYLINWQFRLLGQAIMNAVMEQIWQECMRENKPWKF